MNTEELIKDILKEATERGVADPMVRILLSKQIPGYFVVALGRSVQSQLEPSKLYISSISSTSSSDFKSSVLHGPDIHALLFNLRTEVMRNYQKPKPSCDGKEVEMDGRRYILREVK